MSEEMLERLTDRNNPPKEKYLVHGTESQRNMAARSALRHAAFFLHQLRKGMHILDCGSGSGSITLDLACLVAPGQVVGIDIDESEVERARALAGERGANNVRFQTDNVYNLPFANTAFDVVFSNALFDHLSEPLVALAKCVAYSNPAAWWGFGPQTLMAISHTRTLLRCRNMAIGHRGTRQSKASTAELRNSFAPCYEKPVLYESRRLPPMTPTAHRRAYVYSATHWRLRCPAPSGQMN